MREPIVIAPSEAYLGPMEDVVCMDCQHHVMVPKGEYPICVDCYFRRCRESEIAE